MTDKTIITCAVTGSADTVGRNPAVPVTPAEIAGECIGAARAGAAIVHIHVRDPETGRPSTDLALYKETVDRIRDNQTDVVINLTTGPGARFHVGDDNPREAGPLTTLAAPEARVSHVVELKPEICSLDIGTMNSGGAFGNTVMVNATSHVSAMARAIRAAGVKPELEVFDLGHLRLACDLIDKGLIDPPPFFQMALGVDWGAPASPAVIETMKSMLPEGACWAAFGVSRASIRMVASSFLAGGHVRVGLEDNLYLRRGAPAPSNAALVDQAVDCITLLGGDIASPQEARALLGLC